jgi:hypothetical protein
MMMWYIMIIKGDGWEIHDLYIHKKYSWQKDVRLYSYVEVWIIIIHDYVNLNVIYNLSKYK